MHARDVVVEEKDNAIHNFQTIQFLPDLSCPQPLHTRELLAGQNNYHTNSI